MSRLIIMLALLASNAHAWDSKRATGRASGLGNKPATLVYAEKSPGKHCLRVLTPDGRTAWSCPTPTQGNT